MSSTRDGKTRWFECMGTYPGLEELDAAIESLRGEEFDSVIAFGGGSAIDSAKALAIALAPNEKPLSLRSLLEDPARLAGRSPLPLFAIPTTSGTGSEVTPFATIWDHGNRRKLSLSGPMVFPRAAFVDPDLTAGMPKETAVSTGLDALNQAAESIWNRHLTPISEGLATRALRLGLDSLLRLAADPADGGAQAAMSECSLLAGLAISQTRTALCHSISYPLTAHFGIPHGLACAFTMEAVLRFNLGSDDGRFRRLAAALDPSEASPGSLLRRIGGMLSGLQVREAVRARVGSLGRLLAFAPEMSVPGRADNNLAPVLETDIRAILEESWGVAAA
jgi:alcohol dehydrogenase